MTPQMDTYLAWLEDRGFYWFERLTTPIHLVFYCEGASHSPEETQLVENMAKAVGLLPSQYRVIFSEVEKNPRGQLALWQPAAVLNMGKCHLPPFFQGRAGGKMRVLSTFSVGELLAEPARKRETWLVLLALKEAWS